MAYMFPEVPKKFSPYSLEDIIFNALAQLSDEYYVFHSMSIVYVTDNEVNESETDFVVFHPKKGLLCIEAKAGQVRYESGYWWYGSGIPMRRGGPFQQAADKKWEIMTVLNKKGLSHLVERCKLLHAAWFPSVTLEKFKGVFLPLECDQRLMLTKEDLEHTSEALERVFSVEIKNHNVENKMSQADINDMLYKVLAPHFDLVSIPELKMNHRKMVFKMMLKEQISLLNYLQEQNQAVINGLAGTGKTIMAVRKAQSHADNGEKVLFLCYNRYLKLHLSNSYENPNIDFYTIDGLACKLCDTREANYEMLKEVLLDMSDHKIFPYRHIIIDEGQDFGKESMDETEIIELLKLNVLDDESKNGTFYLFYDKNQMIQSDKIPDYIQNSDCKLTLYKNCRNTELIATTSLRLLGEKRHPKLFYGAVAGDSPEMFFAVDAEKTVKILNRILERCWESGYENIQILTCRTEEKSLIEAECSTEGYVYKGKRIPFTSCRKFKGLEADVIILLDIDSTMFHDSNQQIMYVGASRARFQLFMILQMDDLDCRTIMKASDKKTKNPQKSFAAAYNAKCKK